MKKDIFLLGFLALFSLVGLAAAQSIVIPADQPICRLYGIIRLLATVIGVIVAAVAGIQLTTSDDTNARNSAKGMISGVVVGLIVIWLAPILVKSLVGAGDICGW